LLWHHSMSSLFTHPGPYDFHGLCCSLILMVSPTQHGNGGHLVCLLRCRNRMYWRLRNPLPKPLLGLGLIEVHRRRFEKAAELLLMEDQDVIQTCSSHTSQKPFTQGIREARVRYGGRSTLMPLVVVTRAKFGPYFRSLSRMR
jgi:hypothetical protein